MEKNEIGNIELIRSTMDNATDFLVSQNLIDPNNGEISFEFGYIYTRNDGLLESLFRITFSKKTFYLALQDNKLKLLDIDQNIYMDTVTTMKKVHSCLNDLPKESSVAMERRQKNNEILKNNNIIYSENLLSTYNDDNVSIKDINLICKKAIASLLTIQISCDIRKGLYNESKEYFKPFLEKYGVSAYLNQKEKRIIDGTYTEQDVIDLDWEYEAYWALCWCLGLVEDISDASVICDCDKAIAFVMSNETSEEFISKCNLRSIQEILDMEDLYFRYNWAINEKKVNNDANIGNINPSVVIERRRGLEWVISSTNDWYDINLSA